MKKTYSIGLFFSIISSVSFCQERTVSLWPEKIPNSQKTTETESVKNDDILWIGNVQEPSLEIFLPAKRNSTGRAVVICPGGGYAGLAYDWEGTDIAKWFNSKGIAAFVLKYRLPQSSSVKVSFEAPLQDAQQALKIVRSNAEKWNINKDQIGIMGFSAGGHLASTLGTHFESKKGFEKDTMHNISARPDFMILIYPVITMDKTYTHTGSRNNLLGNNPDNELVEYYSNELQVTENTPPTFLLHSTDDKAVPVMNSLLFYQALVEKEIYSEMHIFPTGGHGYSLATGKGALGKWPELLHSWLLTLE